jgi:hypothetical protein
MIPVTVYVPEHQLGFFSELIKNLHFEQDTDDIPEWHKTIIDQRLKEYEQNPSDVLNWDEVKHTFKLR